MRLSPEEPSPATAQRKVPVALEFRKGVPTTAEGFSNPNLTAAEDGERNEGMVAYPRLSGGARSRRKAVAVLGLLLALAWVAIAGCWYLLWRQRGSMRPPNTAGEPRWTEVAGAFNHSTRLPNAAGKTQGAILGEAVARFETEVAELRTRVAELEGARELQRLANEAIADGHRPALRKLDEYLRNPEIPALKDHANAEIIRVESYYITTRRFRGFPGEMPSVTESDPVAGLARLLLDGGMHWGIRAQAARMLGEKKQDIQAADALAGASDADPNLYVVQESILAFSNITGFRSSGVFDGRSVAEWWTKNRDSFGQVITPRKPQPPAPAPPDP